MFYFRKEFEDRGSKIMKELEKEFEQRGVEKKKEVEDNLRYDAALLFHTRFFWKKKLFDSHILRAGS